MGIQSEKPIKNKEEDKLKRTRFAFNVAKKINNYKYSESITIGLMGSWGSGKSSVINMIEDEIDESKLIVVKFNPWYFSGRKQLISDFFGVLSNSIGINNNVKQLGKDLKLYSSALKPLTLIPQIGSMLNIIYKLTDKGGNAINEYYELQSQDISKIKERINYQIREYDKKILVIIDEIDRLENDDIKEIFQLVRALGDFDNMIYLLSFDKEKVCKVFSTGEDYLDKIINIPLYIPDVSMKNVNDYFINELGNIFNNKDKIDAKYWQGIYKCVFENNFENLREVNRFLNIIRFSYDDIVKDLNLVDYLMINFLRMFDVEIYKFIKENKNILVDVQNREKASNFQKNSNIKVKKKINLNELLKLVFYKPTTPQKRGIANKNYFDSYFEYSLSDDILPFYEIDKYINFNKKDDLELFLKDMTKENLVILFNNLDNISEKLKKDQIYFYEEILVEKILLLDKKVKNKFVQNSEQTIAFLSLKNMVMGLEKNDKNIDNLVEKLVFSKDYEVESFLQYLLELKEYFIDDNFKQKLIKKLNEYIYNLKYTHEIKRSFDILKKLGFNVGEYIKYIISDEERLVEYLQSLIVVVDVHYNDNRDEYGEVIGVEEHFENAIVLEDIINYINYDYVKQKVDSMSKTIKKENKELINEFYNSKTYEEVFWRDIERQKLEEKWVNDQNI